MIYSQIIHQISLLSFQKPISEKKNKIENLNISENNIISVKTGPGLPRRLGKVFNPGKVFSLQHVV